MIESISLTTLGIATIPMFIAIAILTFQKILVKETLVAFIRMVTQLLFVGFVLNYVFMRESSLFVLFIIFFMLIIASIISLRTIKKNMYRMLPLVVCSIFIGGGLNLFLLTRFVLQISPWYQANFIIPLAGMLFFNCLNALSLGLERYQSERGMQKTILEAKRIAMKTALIPAINTFLAVGLVSLPGLMTGQILAGVSPLVAVRYQIVILCSVFSSQVITLFVLLSFIHRVKEKRQEPQTTEPQTTGPRQDTEG